MSQEEQEKVERAIAAAKAKMAGHWGLTGDQLEDAIREGKVYPIRMKSVVDSSDTSLEEVTFTIEKEEGVYHPGNDVRFPIERGIVDGESDFLTWATQAMRGELKVGYPWDEVDALLCDDKGIPRLSPLPRPSRPVKPKSPIPMPLDEMEKL